MRIGVVDLVTKGPTDSLYGRINHPNLVSIMPQAVAVWCRQAGHEVRYVSYTGREELERELPTDTDLVFIGAFTQAALLAYALSNLLRSRGAVTALGGPHARCYPDDAVRHFDYVLGFTDRDLIEDVLADPGPRRPRGLHLEADGQPESLPTLRERWPYVVHNLEKAPTPLKGVPMLASIGCPYTCSFCIDSTVAYRPADSGALTEDLRFLAERLPGGWVGWHDPNFGVRFDECLSAIEAADPEGKLKHVAESSLSLLSRDRLERLEKAGFQAMLPGVESWFSLGNKAKTRGTTGMEKVEKVADHINMVMDHIPYVQANFVLGLDVDEGPEPFELTKRFLDLAPGVFPGYSLLSAFGRAAPLNLEYQEDDRVLPFPFHFLNNNHAMNVRPLNYGWKEFYDHVIDLTRYSFSPRRIWRRARANRGLFPVSMNVLRAVSSEGYGRIEYFTELRRRLDEDAELRAFFEGDYDTIPSFYVERVRRDLGPFWEWLPEGGMRYDHEAYLREARAKSDGGELVELDRPRAGRARD